MESALSWLMKHIQGKLWEMRGKGKSEASLYAAHIGQMVVILRTFVKKTRTTPCQEIKLALARAREIGDGASAGFSSEDGEETRL